MRALVISDSHLRLETLIKIYEKEQPEIVICAGDHSKDGEELSYIFSQSEYYIVQGNCDIFDRSNPVEMVFQLKDKKILLAHGHEYGVKSNYHTIYRRGIELGCDLVIFGHTHIQYYDKDEKIILFNPGAVLNNQYGILEILDEEIKLFHKEI